MPGSPPLGSTERGHRARPHTADVIIEAWGPEFGDCVEECVRALVETFADTESAPASETVPVDFSAIDPEELLVEALEEVVYLLDVLGVVPVRAALDDLEGGGLAGAFEVVPVRSVEAVGAAPKAVSRSGLVIEQGPNGWFASVTVDV